MAESLAEKLKRIAREKAAAKAAEVVVVVDAVIAAPVDTAVDTVVANDQPKVEEIKEENSNYVDSKHDTRDEEATSVPSGAVGSTGSATEVTAGIHPPEGFGNSQTTDAECTTSQSVVEVDGTRLSPTPSNHPLAMQFAEMEQALLSADPTFKTILRDVHRHLGKDPALVTLMTEEEVALVVKGLVVFANAEVVEPAKAKAVKAGVTAAKKKVISADDL